MATQTVDQARATDRVVIHRRRLDRRAHRRRVLELADRPPFWLGLPAQGDHRHRRRIAATWVAGAPRPWCPDAFEARSQGFRDRCLRFADGIAPAQRKTRFRLRTSLYRTGLATRRATTEGFRQILAHLPAPAGLAWSDTTLDNIPVEWTIWN